LLEALSDDELLARHRAAGGAEDGGIWIRELFRRHYPKVVTWCLRFAGDREEAYDLAQAIFERAYAHLESFRGDGRISTWLYAITKNECMSFLEARRRRPAPGGANDLEDLPDAMEPDPAQAIEREGSAELVRALLQRALDETEKQVFTLHYGDDVPLEVITRLLGLSNCSGAKAYIVSARRELARAVRAWKAREQALELGRGVPADARHSDGREGNEGGARALRGLRHARGARQVRRGRAGRRCAHR
jgi:RNA polymerase sigma-70 factor (ECF subfamily)